MIEEWRAVVGYEGFYEVSDKGRVRSLPRFIRCRNGVRYHKGKVLKTHKDNSYVTVGLNVQGVSKSYRVHTLVAKAFIPCPDDSFVVHHIDENKSNNTLSNLMWCSDLDNTRYSLKLKQSRGEVHHRSKLNVEQVKQIRNKKEEGERLVNLAKEFNVSEGVIFNIVHRKNYKWVI